MISKAIFSILTLIFSISIGRDLRFRIGKKLAWIFLIIGIINGLTSLYLLLKNDYVLSFNLFLGFEVFTIIGVICIFPNIFSKQKYK